MITEVRGRRTGRRCSRRTATLRVDAGSTRGGTAVPAEGCSRPWTTSGSGPRGTAAGRPAAPATRRRCGRRWRRLVDAAARGQRQAYVARLATTRRSAPPARSSARRVSASGTSSTSACTSAGRRTARAWWGGVGQRRVQARCCSGTRSTTAASAGSSSRPTCLNDRSQAAIARLGATREGVLRRHVCRADGTFRDTVVFSILRDEWPPVRAGLRARLPRDPAARVDGCVSSARS